MVGTHGFHLSGRDELGINIKCHQPLYFVVPGQCPLLRMELLHTIVFKCLKSFSCIVLAKGWHVIPASHDRDNKSSGHPCGSGLWGNISRFPSNLQGWFSTLPGFGTLNHYFVRSSLSRYRWGLPVACCTLPFR